jgi:tetratricopeptide (TPR) repeat protein
LHQQGREAGATGDYRKALVLLERASGLAPDWPYPVYDMAWTYLLMDDAGRARKYYRRTIELSPRGFFTAITALHTLEREHKGDLPEGTYLAFVSLEAVNDPGEKANRFRQMTTRIPTFAPAWKELTCVSRNDAERRSAIENGLAAHPDLDTRGFLLINKAQALTLRGEHAAARRILEELAFNPESTMTIEAWAKALLRLPPNS